MPQGGNLRSSMVFKLANTVILHVSASDSIADTVRSISWQLEVIITLLGTIVIIIYLSVCLLHVHVLVALVSFAEKKSYSLQVATVGPYSST
jgi:hypothetical protein